MCILFPCVLVTRVLPMFLCVNIAGALTSYQSFFVYGSMLQQEYNHLNIQL